MNTLFAIVGPTAVGKSAVAVELAQVMNAEIIYVDSVAVYKNFNIGTAKPPHDEKKGIRHHLIDIVSPSYFFTAGDYCRKAHAAISEITNIEKKVLLVGGTGLYLRALTQGMFKIPEIPQHIKKELMARLEKEGKLVLYNELKQHDPVTAEMIHPHDGYRILRALEVFYGTGKMLTTYREDHRHCESLKVKKIGLNLPRHELHHDIELRTQKMIQAGLVDEVRTLKEKYDASCKPFGSVGYKETLQYLHGDIENVQKLIEKIVIETRSLARRQLTWFREDKNIKWFDAKKDLGLIRTYLREA